MIVELSGDGGTGEGLSEWRKRGGGPCEIYMPKTRGRKKGEDRRRNSCQGTTREKKKVGFPHRKKKTGGAIRPAPND